MRRLVWTILTMAVLAIPSMTFGNTQSNAQDNSGLQGRTIYKVFSGAEGGQATERTFSIEFAIAPVEGDSPIYSKAIFVKSDEQGMFEVALPPGRYWIGPKAKALDPKQFDSSVREVIVVSEKMTVVKEGVFTLINVYQEDYAP